MNKTKLILKYFQKANRLSTKNKEYNQTLTQLFSWLSSNDEIHNDKSSKYLPDIPSTAIIVSKDNGIIAGLKDLEYLLKTSTLLSFTPRFSDGNKIKKRDIVAQISGKSHEILSYERTILNILQRMSGIATETNRLVKSINRQQTTDNKIPYIAATRKTPWMMLDKKAVVVGGGLTHRLNLSDMVLIKDNHLALIRKKYELKTDEDAIERALESAITRLHLVKGVSKEMIEIEVKNEKEAFSAIRTYHKFISNYQLSIANYSIAIMFDNFSPIQAKKLLDKLSDHDKSQIIFEASGGITEKNIMEWAKTGVDIISLGSLTHSTHAANLSLEICPF